MDQRQIREIVEKITQADPNYLIVRAQTRKDINIKFQNGKIESVSMGNESGIGVQAFTPKGACGFSSANTINPETAAELARKAQEIAVQNERIGCELNQNIFQAARTRAEIPAFTRYKFEDFTPEILQEYTKDIHNRLLDIHINSASLSWQTSYRQVEDFWCIGRTDGTLVSFVVPRSVIFHQGTVKRDQHAQSFSIHRSGVDAEILVHELNDQALHHKAYDKANFVFEVCNAPSVPSGSYPLLIDYALAKGLAHEAFGHAVESDLLEESVLSEQGRLRKGLVISGEGVDIVDGSIEGDWAYQPYSANGILRETVEIVKNGVLNQGLGDIFSASKAGIEVTGAGRAEYFGSVPLPRMTNIRLLTRHKIRLPYSKNLHEEIQAIRETLQSSNLLMEDHHYLLLGYRGGQVNIKTGDFVFQCDGAVNLADPSLPVYQPGIFSGKVLSVLESVKLGIGEEKADAIGTCGKAGQMVPSSGGGSGYIYLHQNDQVRMGGDSREQ